MTEYRSPATRLHRDRGSRTSELDSRSGKVLIGLPRQKGDSVATLNPGASAEALAALVELANVISDPDKRRSLAAAEPADTAATLQEMGVTVQYIPERVVSGLASASEQELEFLSRRNDDLVASGLNVEVPDKGGAGIL
jgi:hypothetical protein